MMVVSLNGNKVVAQLLKQPISDSMILNNYVDIEDNSLVFNQLFDGDVVYYVASVDDSALSLMSSTASFIATLRAPKPNITSYDNPTDIPGVKFTFTADLSSTNWNYVSVWTRLAAAAANEPFRMSQMWPRAGDVTSQLASNGFCEKTWNQRFVMTNASLTTDSITNSAGVLPAMTLFDIFIVLSFNPNIANVGIALSDIIGLAIIANQLASQSNPSDVVRVVTSYKQAADNDLLGGDDTNVDLNDIAIMPPPPTNVTFTRYSESKLIGSAGQPEPILVLVPGVNASIYYSTRFQLVNGLNASFTFAGSLVEIMSMLGAVNSLISASFTIPPNQQLDQVFNVSVTNVYKLPSGALMVSAPVRSALYGQNSLGDNDFFMKYYKMINGCYVYNNVINIKTRNPLTETQLTNYFQKNDNNIQKNGLFYDFPIPNGKLIVQSYLNGQQTTIFLKKCDINCITGGFAFYVDYVEPGEFPPQKNLILSIYIPPNMLSDDDAVAQNLAQNINSITFIDNN